ncbi:DNA polymerase IV [Tepidibacter mesophilus]|uniref:DNA polymerase IV n=1 Tax=Tepidibacter mesophilus TaxID=655607 RepID=UPI000C08A255|nr:DNA polymerase IV [Tepidibacter mesophilus]
MIRKIIHVDMDAFFASVEQVDNPSLKGKPVIVGGRTSKGVVCTCSYEARKYGVKSAMPGFIAAQKCPNGIFLPVRYSRYKEVSNEVFDILYSITNIVEPLSIDEAYLDVSDIDTPPIEIGHYIKNEVFKKTGLTISVGISHNKFLAKLGSDWNKPDGLKVITEEMVPEILKPLSIKIVYGIGKKTITKLNNIGVYTVNDLLNLPKDYFVDLFSNQSWELYNRLLGIDNRPVQPNRETKSLGRETTFSSNTDEIEYLMHFLSLFSKDISYTLKKQDMLSKTITIKIKASDFSSHSRSKTIHHYTDSYDEIYSIACNLLKEINIQNDIRLIGLSVSNLSDNKIEQLTFL